MKHSCRYPVIVSSLGALVAALLVSGASMAQLPPAPPDEFVATSTPVYYEGHAAYWWGNYWYYRDEHGLWRHYDREPRELGERRARGLPARRDYGHPAARAVRRR